MAILNRHSRFIVQVLFSFAFIGVAIALIFKDFQNQGTAFTIGISFLTFVIGLWAPSIKNFKVKKAKNEVTDAEAVATKSKNKKLTLTKEEKRQLRKEKEEKRLLQKKEKKSLELKKKVEKKQKSINVLMGQITPDVVKEGVKTGLEIDPVDFGTLEKDLEKKIEIEVNDKEVIVSGTPSVPTPIPAVAETPKVSEPVKA